MKWAGYAVWAVALFFAITWAFGLVASHRNRTGGNILTVLCWWAAIVAAASDAFDVMHLLWVFPLALVLPPLILLPFGRR